MKVRLLRPTACTPPLPTVAPTRVPTVHPLPATGNQPNTVGEGPQCLVPRGGTRRAQLVRRGGRGVDETCPVSTGGRDETCPVSTGGRGGRGLVACGRKWVEVCKAVGVCRAVRVGIGICRAAEVCKAVGVWEAARTLGGRRDETCPVSTGGGTRRVQSVRKGGGGGGAPGGCQGRGKRRREKSMTGGVQ